MFASKAESRTFAKREKPYTRKTRPMTRSGSLLDTIKDIVAAPLSWFASNQEDFEDLGKRRRVATQEFEDIEEQRDERRGKRMRVDSPELPVHAQPPGGYLDPPPLSSFASRLIARRSPEKRVKSDKRASSVGPSIPPSRHAMSLEPQSRYATFGRRSARVSLSSKSPIGLNPYGSTTAGTDAERSRIPSGLQTAFPPQSDPASPRREFSAPPFPSLQSRPTFVKPPAEEKQNQAPSAQRKVTLGTLADLSRASRAPSRDRTLNILGQTSGDSDQIVPLVSSDAISQPSKSLSAKAYHELERYKTPILPSRYKDASEVPPFLKPKRSHVPIPMSRKGRGSRPSLGMSEAHEKQKTDAGSRDGGKPYARTGGTGTLIARRKAEEEEERQRNIADSTLTSVDEDDEMETDGPPPVSKRDVGVSAQLPSGSEDERTRSHIVPVETIETPPVPSFTAGDPFSHPPVTTPGGRPQPYGRVSRTRTREPGQRSVALPRGRNKYSAKPADDEITIMEDQSMLDVTSTDRSQAGAETTRTPAYEAPKGFSFPNDTASINHDMSRAKEPPIPSLPFSLGGKSGVTGTSASKPKEATSFKPPTTTLPVFQVPSERGKEKRDEFPLCATPVSVKRAALDQSANEVKETSAPAASNMFTAASSSSGVESPSASGKAPKPAGMPNFFANSPLLAGNKATAPSGKAPSSAPFPTSAPGTTPATPVKDPENPLWDGNVTSGAPPKLFAASTKPATFGAGEKSGAESVTAALPVPTPPSGEQTNQATAGSTSQQQSNTAAPVSWGKVPPSVTTSTAEPPQAQPALAKPPEPDKKSPSALFSFGGGTTSNVPKPLFGTGSVASSAFPTQPGQNGQGVAKESTPKQIFAFGQPQTPETGGKPPVTQSSQPSQSGPAPTEQKSTFTFGAPPMPTGTGDASVSTIHNAVAAPKPVVGGPGGGTTFTFGLPTSPAQTTETVKPSSPFAFGAPPATPPAGGERQSSPFPFGAPGPSSGASTGFTFGTPIKENGSTAGSAPSTPTNTSPFVFGAHSEPVRPVTPPSKPDEGMSMEESPVQMDTNGGQKRPAASISFGAGPTPVNPFGQSSGPTFTFGSPVASNPFAQKDEHQPSDFNFNRTTSAPTISTSFSFGAKSDQSTPPATAFGAPPNPFTSSQPTGQTTTPFTFGQQQAAPLANPFGASTQPTQTTGAPGSAPGSPFSSAATFNFGAPPGGSSNPFAFGSNAPSSPAAGANGLPQTSSTSGSTPSFTFGQPSASGSSTGGTFFNIGAPPPAANPSTPARAMKKLPRRAAKH